MLVLSIIFYVSSNIKLKTSKKNFNNYFFLIDSGGACQPCTTAQMQTDYVYQQQRMHTFFLYLFLLNDFFLLVLEYDAEDSKKIQIRCQPRSKFRPRTQNESKTSSHYLRCDEGIRPEYPTVNVCYSIIGFK
jgi:hypothetical protein